MSVGFSASAPLRSGDELRMPDAAHAVCRAIGRSQGRSVVPRSGGTRLAAVSPIPAVAQTDTVPAVNQVEAHPYFANAEVCAYNQEYGITTEAWSPLARGRALDEPVVTRIAVASGRSPVQVVLR